MPIQLTLRIEGQTVKPPNKNDSPVGKFITPQFQNRSHADPSIQTEASDWFQDPEVRWTQCREPPVWFHPVQLKFLSFETFLGKKGSELHMHAHIYSVYMAWDVELEN